jgi:hypothetical protein
MAWRNNGMMGNGEVSIAPRIPPFRRISTIPSFQMKTVFHSGLWFTAGITLMLLGIIGLLLPVIPQVPFFLAAILCLMRGSTRLHHWMEKQPLFTRLRRHFKRQNRS